MLKQHSIGTIKGRHKLPTLKHIINGDIELYTKEELLPVVLDGLDKLKLFKIPPRSEEIQLYITGLTIVTLVIMEELISRGYTVYVMGYSPIIKEYYVQGKFNTSINIKAN